MLADIPMGVLAYMSPDEVTRVVAEMRAEADRLERLEQGPPLAGAPSALVVVARTQVPS